jgi:hypothetical protein
MCGALSSIDQLQLKRDILVSQWMLARGNVCFSTATAWGCYSVEIATMWEFAFRDCIFD